MGHKELEFDIIIKSEGGGIDAIFIDKKIMNKEEINGMATIPDQEKILYTSGYVKDLKDKMEDLQQRIDKAIEYTKHLRDEYFRKCIFGSSEDLSEIIDRLNGENNDK